MDAAELHKFAKSFEKDVFKLSSTSSSKINKISKLAVSSPKNYKTVVHVVEKFARKGKTKNNSKLPVLYLMDCICKAAKTKFKEKDHFVPRFSSRFDKIASVLDEGPISDSKNFLRILGMWSKKRWFPEADVQRLIKSFEGVRSKRKVPPRSNEDDKRPKKSKSNGTPVKKNEIGEQENDRNADVFNSLLDKPEPLLPLSDLSEELVPVPTEEHNTSEDLVTTSTATAVVSPSKQLGLKPDPKLSDKTNVLLMQLESLSNPASETKIPVSIESTTVPAVVPATEDDDNTEAPNSSDNEEKDFQMDMFDYGEDEDEEERLENQRQRVEEEKLKRARERVVLPPSKDTSPPKVPPIPKPKEKPAEDMSLSKMTNNVDTSDHQLPLPKRSRWGPRKNNSTTQSISVANGSPEKPVNAGTPPPWQQQPGPQSDDISKTASKDDDAFVGQSIPTPDFGSQSTTTPSNGPPIVSVIPPPGPTGVGVGLFPATPSLQRPQFPGPPISGRPMPGHPPFMAGPPLGARPPMFQNMGNPMPGQFRPPQGFSQSPYRQPQFFQPFGFGGPPPSGPPPPPAGIPPSRQMSSKSGPGGQS
eukprot:234006_1